MLQFPSLLKKNKINTTSAVAFSGHVRAFAGATQKKGAAARRKPQEAAALMRMAQRQPREPRGSVFPRLGARKANGKLCAMGNVFKENGTLRIPIICHLKIAWP